jgi:hypothetical protein
VRDLGDFLAEGGAIVGGGAALGATPGFIVARRRLRAVRQRTRKYVWMVVAALAGLVYARISRDWSFGTFYAGFAGVVAVVVLVGGVWTELAPDGDLRRTRQT